MAPLPTIPEPFISLGHLAVQRKMRSVRRSDGDTPHFLDFERAGRRILRLGAPTSDEMFEQMVKGIITLNLDVVTLAVDTWLSSRDLNPITGKDWEFGDMDRIATEDAGVERGLLSEGFNFVRGERDSGFVSGATLCYTHDRVEKTITWRAAAPYGSSKEGRIPRLLTEAFAEPTLMDRVLATVGPPSEHGIDHYQRKIDVTFTLMLPTSCLVLEGPKGAPLAGFMEGFSFDGFAASPVWN
jgi:hypothetical protein